MADAATSKPAWQTDDLLDEWPDDDEPTTSSHGGTRSSVSFTVPVGSIRVHGSEDGSPNAGRSSSDDTDAAGTFLIRQDAPAAILPKTPGKNAIKDFFSPLPLERMFEPPSPPQNSTQPASLNPSAPAVPSRLSQAHRAASFSFQDDDDVVQSSQTVELQENEKEMVADDGLKPDMNCQFTFNVPRHTPSNALTPSGTGFPQAQSTPGRPSLQIPSAPQTDPRLRLFQFQYDTFTRDHLSAMVDSIAVNSPSLSNTGNLTPAGSASSPFALSRVSDLTPQNSDARSAKRVKLSPVSDYYGEGEGEGAVIQRPQLEVPLQKDYVGESRSLMAQIKQQARDFSTISTVASAQSPAARADRTPHQARADPPAAARQAALSVPVTADSDASAAGSSGSKRTSYSSLGYREQAASLMAQIKSDMKGAKRLFSVDTDVSRTRADVTEQSQSFRSDGRSLAPDLSRSARRPHYPPSPRDKARGTRHASRTVFRKPDSSADDVTTSTDAASAAGSMDTSQLYAQFPAPPIVIAPAPTPPRAPSPVSQPNPRAHPPPPANANLLSSGYPSSSLRSRANEDLNRFVSSSTASGTTLTTGSAASFVKHAGPAQITRIAPEDVPALPERVGRMMFDKVTMRWVKATADAVRVPGPVSDGGYAASAEGDSEDPFRDIESLREEDSGEREEDGGQGQDPRAVEMSRIEEVEDEEEVELTSFSFDGPSQHMLQIINGDAGVEDGLIIDDDETTDSDHDDAEVTELTQMSASMSLGAQGVAYGHDPQLDDDDGPTQTLPNPSDSFLDTPLPPAATSTPLAPRANTSGPVRSVLKSTSVTPVSALKNGSLRHQTPANRHRHRRSVSFSDGKREGQIRGLGRASDDADSGPSDSDGDVLPAGTASFVPSARSKRITDMMEDLADTSVDDDSPSKTGNSGRPASDEMQPLTARWPLEAPASSSGRRAPQPSTEVSRRANGTFLTEASFGVAHDKLVQVITDVQPFEPYWEDLSSIDLSRKHIESVARLKEFLPKLDSLSLNCNQLSWLSGVPTSVRTLSIADNALTRVTSFNHLLGLENLDVSRNNIDSLKQLECLRHLRELRADGNHIRDLDGLQGMDGLVKLSLQGNSLGHAVDFDGFAWPRLEVLNLSRNRIERVGGLGSLASLIVLNLDNNWITDLDAHGTLGRLRILRASANKLKALDVAPYPNLRTLYADNNFIAQVTHARTLSRLENLSLRNQGTKGLSLSIRDVRDVRRLYLSGNPLPPDFLSEACYNLIYLEIAACRLSALPPRMAALVPNLRVLNLNYNFLEDVRPLEGLGRLSKLTIVGSRLKGTRGLLRVLKGAPDMEMVDFRMNPCTLGWYLPLLVKDVPGALQPSEPGQRPATGAGASWQELDAKFRRDLPDAAYVGRLAYRGLVMQACARVKMLDGVLVTRKEQDKAARFLEGVGRARAAGPG